MTKRILFNFATRSRPTRFFKAIDEINNLCATNNYMIVAKIDEDDVTFDDLAFGFPQTRIAMGKSLSKIHAINRDIPANGWDILVNMSDDISWLVKGFDNIIRDHCGADDFCLFPEKFADSQARKLRKERLAVVSIMGREYFNRDGYVYHPSYKRTHCDEEAAEVARLRGRMKEVNVPIYIHEHPSAGYKHFNDVQYLLERKTWAEDLANLNKRRAEGFPK